MLQFSEPDLESDNMMKTGVNTKKYLNSKRSCRLGFTATT